MTLPRREFLTDAAALGAAALALPALELRAEARAPWSRTPDRIWLGPDFWANPLQDWRLAGGRLECLKAARGRNVQWLTREVSDRPGDLTLRVRLGSLDAPTLARAEGAAGFSVGVRGPLADYRNRLTHGAGFHLGLRSRGELFIGDGPNGQKAAVDWGDTPAVDLEAVCTPSGEGMRVVLRAHDARDGRRLGEVVRDDVPDAFFPGHLALVSNFGPTGKPPPNTPAPGRWWFADWSATGSRIAERPERAFGPFVLTQYTLHRKVLKLTAQLLPVGAADDAFVTLQSFANGSWRDLGRANLDPFARCATFRVENWDDRTEARVRVVHVTRDAAGQETRHSREALIRRDPVERDEIRVADISCNAHFAFPNAEAAAAVQALDPDLVAFTGDQYYESTGGFGVDISSVDNSCLDVLHKWCLHALTWGELVRDRPSVSIPDDHDVYHGNLWGEGGGAAPAHTAGAEAKGGYKLKAEVVNAVHRMQTAHHPDSPGRPGQQGITAYYGPLTWGGVSFAILADRQYKSGPDGKVPPTKGRADHVDDPNFDPRTADRPGLDLLGEEQMAFLRDWARDWRGAEMKAAISQTLFTAMATHHGGKAQRLVADYDTNGWPQSARNAAVRVLRACRAFHLAGDQHLPAVVQYGVDAPRDAVPAFASPAINNLYPRRFLPPGGQDPRGDFRDSFGHPLAVLACANPADKPRPGVLESEVDKSSGIGLVRFHKREGRVGVDCWPLLADPRRPGTQFPGWPVELREAEFAFAGPGPRLPDLVVEGIERPVLEIQAPGQAEPLLILRARTVTTPGPRVPAAGPYRIRIRDAETGRTLAEEIEAVAAEAPGPALRLSTRP
jgi:hypothetical protein